MFVFFRHSKQFRQLFESQSSVLPNIQCICSVVSLISRFHTKIISLILVSTQHVTCFSIYIYVSIKEKIHNKMPIISPIITLKQINAIKEKQNEIKG